MPKIPYDMGSHVRLVTQLKIERKKKPICAVTPKLENQTQWKSVNNKRKPAKITNL